MRKPTNKADTGSALPRLLLLITSFLLGCVVSGSIALHLSVATSASQQSSSSSSCTTEDSRVSKQLQQRPSLTSSASRMVSGPLSTSSSSSRTTVLQDLRILVILVAFDFSQIPHLEEALDAYHDVSVSGPSVVDVVIHATIPYPVMWIDLWNDRFNSPQFSLTIKLKPKSLRLHLVDLHRKEFYDRIDDYDLFIYSEDDIRVTPTTVATYWSETRKIQQLLQGQSKHKPEDFNVGVVRYEYNWPSNVVIDDKTRHATQNVTRVYWEHSGFDRPVVPNAVLAVPQAPLAEDYVTMKNHHQGMYLATAPLLKAWKDRCQFHIATNRPGKGAQPSEGTQRVWMSSQMLYGGRHCKVQQVLPAQSFGTLTVLHLPNKNYRRVGKYHNRVFSDGTEVFDQPHPSLLQDMELHVALKQVFPKQLPPEAAALRDASHLYKGIRMIDEIDVPTDRSHLLERRMQEYNEYVRRGGVLSSADFTKTNLMEEL